MGNVTIIRLSADKYDPKPIPEVGKEYHAFDDGKIKPSRHFIVTVDEVISFKAADETLLKIWREEVKQCYWLYATKTDYFIKAVYDDKTSYFVRTKDGGWFSMGWFGARLDIDGSLYEKMKEYYSKE